MEEDNKLKRQVEEAVATFACEYMGIKPKSVVANIHSCSIIATLEGIIPPAERDYAEGRESRELIEKCYNNVFDVSKGVFERTLEDMLGKVVQSSMLRVNPASGDGVMLFNFADASLPQQR